MKFNSVKVWFNLIRPQTTLLAFASVSIGASLAYRESEFDYFLYIVVLVTAISLQILSNLANDLGDGLKGLDNQQRLGPSRAFQNNLIAKDRLIFAIIITVLSSIFFGSVLIYRAFHDAFNFTSVIYVLLGVVAIIAALKYTIGKNPYGYNGLGDLFVFIFFGLVGVYGTFFLFVESFNLLNWLPAISVGLYCVGVLNINNIRDFENDKFNGKITIPVILGLRRALVYHFLLIIIGMFFSLLYFFYVFKNPLQLVFVISFLPFVYHLLNFKLDLAPKSFNYHLKLLVISIFQFSILFHIFLNIV